MVNVNLGNPSAARQDLPRTGKASVATANLFAGMTELQVLRTKGAMTGKASVTSINLFAGRTEP